MLSSSSTIRMVLFIFLISLGNRDRAPQSSLGLVWNRQLEGHHGPLGVVIRNTDAAVMIGNDGIDDRQPQTRPRPFCGEIGLEHLYLITGRDATTVVGHLHLRRTPFPVGEGPDLDSALC